MEVPLGSRVGRLYILRDTLVDSIEQEVERTFEGLAVAARAARTAGVFCSRPTEAAERVDVAYNLVKRLTYQRFERTLTEFAVAPKLGNGIAKLHDLEKAYEGKIKQDCAKLCDFDSTSKEEQLKGLPIKMGQSDEVDHEPGYFTEMVRDIVNELVDTNSVNSETG
ncbi:unnamed protein product, partial [Prorocentrum cordatum]